MKKDEVFHQFRLDVLDGTVFINGKTFNFMFTPPKAGMLTDEYKDKIRYFGGLQADDPPESEEYKRLESWLADLSEVVLKQIGAMK